MTDQVRSGTGEEVFLMTIREQIEEIQAKTLSPYATLSQNSKGRDREEAQCDIRPLFQRDRDRILHCKSFRRLKNKTQVFLTPLGDHYRTRLSHTLEVSQIARTIVKALRLNEDLTEAIALGHDLGHTPFGHAGERALNQKLTDGFRHNEQSVRIVERLEKDGQGLNLTWEVRDGIRNHELELHPQTPEGQVVRLADKIAYVNADIDDSIRAEILDEESIPLAIRKTLGFNGHDRLNTLVHDVIVNSYDKPDIHMSEEIYQALLDLRKFLFSTVYTNPVAKGEEVKAIRMLDGVFDFYMENADSMPELIPEKYMQSYQKGEVSKERMIADYISGMTDQYAVTKFNELFMPQAWQVDGF